MQLALSHKATAEKGLYSPQLFSFSGWLRLNTLSQLGALATWDGGDKKGTLKVGADHKASDDTSVRGNFEFPSMRLTMGLRQKLTSHVHMLFTSYIETSDKNKPLAVGYSIR